MSIVIFALIIIGVEVLGSIWNGYVLTVLWGWFVVPTFHLPILTLAPAIGISLVVSFMTYHPDLKNDDTSFVETMSRAVVAIIFYPLLALVVGWVVHFFM